MENQLYMFITLVLILIIYLILRKKISKKDRKTYNLIIEFEEFYYKDIRKIDKLKAMADWKIYGTNSFRGFSILTKEELEILINNELSLSKEHFKVFHGNPGLYK